MKKKKKYRSLFTSLFSLILVLVFLAPNGLKLEHALIFHSEIEECTNTETHFHTSSNHNDFLDYFFQPIVKSFFKSLKLYKIAIIDKVFDLVEKFNLPKDVAEEVINLLNNQN